MSEVPGNDGPVGPVSEVSEVKGPTLVSIRVNGTSLEVTKEVTVEVILAKAKEAGCIEALAEEEYVIERVSEAGQLSQETTIVVEESEEFVAVPKGPTSVALAG